ncbi:hypothetical protein FB645_004325 [Coemansia sp. IMI 203386]|nr:hypothetical protein FB645_004325 [Coemansia sp. IMI 203386]
MVSVASFKPKIKYTVTATLLPPFEPRSFICKSGKQTVRELRKEIAKQLETHIVDSIVLIYEGSELLDDVELEDFVKDGAISVQIQLVDADGRHVKLRNHSVALTYKGYSLSDNDRLRDLFQNEDPVIEVFEVADE